MGVDGAVAVDGQNGLGKRRNEVEIGTGRGCQGHSSAHILSYFLSSICLPEYTQTCDSKTAGIGSSRPIAAAEAYPQAKGNTPFLS